MTQATSRVPLGTAVTPAGTRYHPAVIAQMVTTLERLAPGRAYLGVGSGESLNESQLGAEWPPVEQQIERMEEALEMIRALWDGKKLSGEGDHFAADGAIAFAAERAGLTVFPDERVDAARVEAAGGAADLHA